MLWGGWGWGWLGMASWSQRIHMMYVLVVASHWYSGKCGSRLSPLLSLPPSTPHELLHNNSNSSDCTQQQQQRVSTQCQHACTMYIMWSVSSHVLAICKYKWVLWPLAICTYVFLFALQFHEVRHKTVIVNKNNLHLCINRRMWLFLLVLLFCNWDYIKLLLAFSCSEQFLILFPAHVATTQGWDAWCVLTKCPEWLRYYLQCEWHWDMQGYISHEDEGRREDFKNSFFEPTIISVTIPYPELR